MYFYKVYGSKTYFFEKKNKLTEMKKFILKQIFDQVYQGKIWHVGNRMGLLVDGVLYLQRSGGVQRSHVLISEGSKRIQVLLLEGELIYLFDDFKH